jgi:hypothetical protein
MTDPKVPETTDPFAALAAELHRIADDLATLVGSGGPGPSYFSIDIHPGPHGNDEAIVRAVDAMAQALLGVKGTPRLMSSGGYHYGTSLTDRGPIKVQVYNSVSTEWAAGRAAAAELAAKEAELEELRAEVERLRGQDYQRHYLGLEESAKHGRAAEPEPVHHFAEQGELACGLAFVNLPKVHGYGQARDAVNCKDCIEQIGGER